MSNFGGLSLTVCSDDAASQSENHTFLHDLKQTEQNLFSTFFVQYDDLSVAFGVLN